MKRMLLPCVATLALIFSGQVGFNASAQEKDYHVFTDKKGKAIEATLLSITEDKTKAEIQLKNGSKFDIPILTLSLNDQQFLRNWLKGNPTKTDHNLEVDVIKHQEGGTKRILVPNYGGLKFLTDTIIYEIKVKNRARTELIGASLEYYIIIEQGVYASSQDLENQSSTGLQEWFYSNGSNGSMRRKKGMRRSSELPLWLIHGKAKVDNIAYNFSTDTKSIPFDLREISQSGVRGGNPKRALKV